jgi:hypothetical protein
MPVPFDADPPIRLLVYFQQLIPEHRPQIVYQAPGRDVWLAAAFNQDVRFSLIAADINPDVETSFTLQTARQMQTTTRRPLPNWARYAAGALVTLSAFDTPGFDGILVADEPPGPRQDYAIALLFAGLIYTLADQPQPTDHLQSVADIVVRDYVGLDL